MFGLFSLFHLFYFLSIFCDFSISLKIECTLLCISISIMAENKMRNVLKKAKKYQ